MIRRIAVLLTAIALVAGCGGAEYERASASSDANALLRDTFANLGEVRSANVDLKLRIEPRGKHAAEGPANLRLRGPFVSQGAGKLPKFALTLTLAEGARSVVAGATYTGEEGYVSIHGQPYELNGFVLRQFEAGYEQAAKNSRGRGGPLLGSLDVAKWAGEARNEGLAQVGGVETVKLTGTGDVERVVADLERMMAGLQGLNLQILGVPVPGRLSPGHKQAAAKAIKSLRYTVYTGAEDRLLRRLVVTADVADPRKGEPIAAVALDLTLNQVGSDLEIAAPPDAKPFSQLLKAFDTSGLGLFGSGAENMPDNPLSTNKVDKFADCISRAAGDRAQARKCAELLKG
jgi:hypothetical protein